MKRHHESSLNEDAAEMERQALGKIVHAFIEYAADADWEVARWEHNYSRLSDRHKALVPHLVEKYKTARWCIKKNQDFINNLIGRFDSDLGRDIPSHLAGGIAAANERSMGGIRVSPEDTDKVRYVLKNMARDWSSEGAAEREQCYKPILDELQRLYPNRPQGPDAPPDAPRPTVLVPGAGLGRLLCEIAAMGFCAEGNEFSYYMLLASSFVLNQTGHPDEFAIYPWVHSQCNNLSDADMLRPLMIPDMHPGSCGLSPGSMSMCAGDFLEVYGGPENAGQWDCVVTCYFIDTAHNILDYLEVIHRCLRPGGTWINLGPLLYHWADSHTFLPRDELSIELSLDDVERIALGMGFRHLGEKQLRESAYTANTKSMMGTMYRCAQWTMVKETGEGGGEGSRSGGAAGSSGGGAGSSGGATGGAKAGSSGGSAQGKGD